MKLEALAAVVSSYAWTTAIAITNFTVVTAAGLEQTVAMFPTEPEDIFWPALGGAMLAALLTIRPAFSQKSEQSPANVAFQAFFSMTAGFLFSFYGTKAAAPLAMSLIPWELPFDAILTSTALTLGVVGEKIVVALSELKFSTIRDWVLEKFGGGK